MWTKFPTPSAALPLLQPWPGQHCAPKGRFCEPSLGLTGLLNEKIWGKGKKIILDGRRSF